MADSVPHFALPFRLDPTGRFATVEQDSPEELAQCVAVCLTTPQGSRVEVPDYGSPRTDFHVPPPESIVDAVHEWEPRVDLHVDVIQRLGRSGDHATIAAAVRPHVQ